MFNSVGGEFLESLFGEFFLTCTDTAQEMTFSELKFREEKCLIFEDVVVNGILKMHVKPSLVTNL